MIDNKNIKVLIVDKQPLFIRGLVSLLKSVPNFKIAGEAATIEKTLEIAEKTKPDLAIVDIDLGEENGLDLIPRLKTQNPAIFILVLSMNDERFYSERILRMGARGYIMKIESEDKVLEAIKTVTSGKVYLSSSEKERIFEVMTGENFREAKDWAMALRKLSNRELQIFSLLGKGLGNLEIASQFNLSTKTIDTYKEHMKLKLHCNSTQELRQFAIEWTSYQGFSQ
jgi:DNA-binding NarL/FixJ family response regulator